MQDWIGLIDCNNFFVSCERLFRPDLKQRPVVVLSSNDGCVVARSKEIKDKGIPMGVPAFQVKDILKDIDAVTFSSHFALYRDISRRVFEVVRRELGVVEQYSIDEAFFTLSGEVGSVYEKIEHIKDKVEREVGIPVSIGVSLSKTQAKYAAACAKKTTGMFVMTQEYWIEHSDAIALSELWGVGQKTTLSFKAYSLRTVQDMMILERRRIHDLFGVVGERLWQELHGQSAAVLARKTEPQKSILHSRSFKHTTSDEEVLQDAVAYHVREASEELRSMGAKTACLQVTIGTSRFGDFLLQGGSKSVMFTQPTDDTFVLLRQANILVSQLFSPGVPYKKAGILLTQFTPSEAEQGSLFASVEDKKTTALMPIIDGLNKRLGKQSVLLGSRLRTKEWHSSQELCSPSYTTSWKDIAVAKA